MYSGQSEIKMLFDGQDITSIVSSIQWTGEILHSDRKISVNISNTIDGRIQFLNIETGKEVIFFNNGEELFRGIVFNTDINDKGEMNISAADVNVYLTKNIDTRKFENKKASDIVKRICDDFEIPYGDIIDTGYVIPKLIFRDKSLFNMMIAALTITEKQTGSRFFIFNKGGKLQLLKRKDQVTKWVLENGVNILSADYSKSIDKMKTQIKVVGGDKEKSPLIATVKNDELINKYGIMQHLENADSDLTKSQVEQLAKELLKQLGTIEDSASIDAIGINEVISGSCIYVTEKMTGVKGAFYVINDSHTFENGKHTMSITLSATDDLPTMEYEGGE